MNNVYRTVSGQLFMGGKVIEINSYDDAKSTSCKDEFTFNGPHKAIEWDGGTSVCPLADVEKVPHNEIQLSPTCYAFVTEDQISFDRKNWFPKLKIIQTCMLPLL